MRIPTFFAGESELKRETSASQVTCFHNNGGSEDINQNLVVVKQESESCTDGGQNKGANECKRNCDTSCSAEAEDASGFSLKRTLDHTLDGRVSSPVVKPGKKTDDIRMHGHHSETQSGSAQHSKGQVQETASREKQRPTHRKPPYIPHIPKKRLTLLEKVNLRLIAVLSDN